MKFLIVSLRYFGDCFLSASLWRWPSNSLAGSFARFSGVRITSLISIRFFKF